jgi:hypothetical protein
MTRPHRPIVCASPAPAIHLREYHGTVSLIIGARITELTTQDARALGQALLRAANLVDTTKVPPPVRQAAS